MATLHSMLRLLRTRKLLSSLSPCLMPALQLAGKLAKRLALQSGGFSGSVSCCAMAASNTLLFVADSQAVITTLRCDIKGGVLQVGSVGHGSACQSC